MIGNKEQMHNGPAVRKERKFQEPWELLVLGEVEDVTLSVHVTPYGIHIWVVTDWHCSFLSCSAFSIFFFL
jgi:hypothetical protein